MLGTYDGKPGKHLFLKGDKTLLIYPRISYISSLITNVKLIIAGATPEVDVVFTGGGGGGGGVVVEEKIFFCLIKSHDGHGQLIKLFMNNRNNESTESAEPSPVV